MKQFLILKQFAYLVLVLSFTSCTRDNIDDVNNATQITVKLKSSNQSSSKVYLDIEDVQIKISENAENSEAWLSLNTVNQGVFNVTDFKEDNTLLLVDDFEVEATYVYEIRLVLGENNFMNINSVLHSLDLGNAKPSNLIETQLNSKRRYDMVIDIDLGESVSYNQEENMMTLNPKLYTAIRQMEY
ncbi:DUF4382 domain-containing protein [Winogradskyella sp. HB-48]|uniref:DUF4382 domain-containing protein n=1 Tax=Winogradskyella sp. HB-48 TaxID=3416808 RepID=UPI003CF9E66D